MVSSFFNSLRCLCFILILAKKPVFRIYFRFFNFVSFFVNKTQKNISKNQKIDYFISEETDSWAPCDICGIFNSPIADLIVLCDGCGVAVHKLCYGIRRIPEGDWFCQPCDAQKKPIDSQTTDKAKIDLNSEESVGTPVTPPFLKGKKLNLLIIFPQNFCFLFLLLYFRLNWKLFTIFKINTYCTF